jgi:hypothetical protein
MTTVQFDDHEKIMLADALQDYFVKNLKTTKLAKTELQKAQLRIFLSILNKLGK